MGTADIERVLDPANPLNEELTTVPEFSMFYIGFNHTKPPFDDAKVRQLEPETYYEVLMEEKDEIYDSGWVADYPDPENFLDILFHSGSEENDGEYSNPQIDALLEQARVEQDEAVRMSLYQKIEQMLVDDAACLPLFFDIEYVLVKPYLENFVVTPMPIPRLRYVSIEPH